jgi:glycosyltransferase involved in cell wall biosynthesis
MRDWANMKIDGNRPLVSAIIPTRNRSDMLIRAVKSVANQTYPNLEIIIVSDGSEYDVEATIRKECNSKSCRVIKNTRTPGAAGARNSGFYESRGEFIGFLDDDDEWMPDKISRQVETFQKSHSSVGIVITSYFIVQDALRILRTRSLEGDVFRSLCKEHNAGNTSSPLMRRNVFEKAGLFDEELRAAQDTDLWLRIAKHYHFTTVNEPLAVIHWEGSDRITKNWPMQIGGIFRFLCKHWSDLHPQRKFNLMKRIVRLSIALAGQKLSGASR